MLFIKIGYGAAILGAILLTIMLAMIKIVDIPWYVSLPIAMGLLLIPAYYHLKRNMIRYTVTDAKIEIDYGLIARTTRNIPISKIQDVTVSASIWQRLLGFGDSTYTNAEVTKQMLIYYKHLNDPATGLLWHAYDESGAQPWANPTTHQSGYHWGRAFGWYAMTLIELLEVLPKNQPQRAELIAIINQLAKAFEKYQDPKTGLWYQVVDKGGVEDNWLETSGSSMYTYMMWMGVKRGYLPKHYAAVAQKGYGGVLTKLSLGADGMTNLIDISEGTNVSDLAYYFARKRNENDFHGLGAFLIMNEQLGAASMKYKPKPLNWKAK